MNAPTVRFELLEGQLALVTISNPPVNTIDASVREGLRQAVAWVRGSADVRAVVLQCEGGTFCSGADIREFNGPPKEGEYRSLFGDIEQLPVPVVVALFGTVLGGGLELALACHYRVALDSVRVGLPEVTLGILPGAGGTQRLPRLIGAAAALELIVSARPVEGARARSLGIVDELVSAELLPAALAYARGLIARGVGPRRTCEQTVPPESASVEVFDRARDSARQLYPNRQAALRAIEAVGASVGPFEAGLDAEYRLVNEAKGSLESRALVHVFFAERETRKIPDIPSDVEPLPVRTVGIVGAGTMGGGIAIACANAGLSVIVVDASQEALDRGFQTMERTYQSMVKRGRLTPEAKAERQQRIQPSLDYERLAQADLIIEAVFEDMALKQGIFERLGKVARADAVLASNTSTLDVEQLGRSSGRPDQLVGLHFFSPANVMPLLEVVRTAQTSARVIRTALEFARTIRKTPVLARVCYGFIGNRMMEGYAREAERLVLEGETPRRVDTVLEQFGMAMGILAVFDMAGLDVGVKVHQANAYRLPPDPTYYQADVALYEAGRLGQKNGRGFYRYEPGDRARHDDPAALELLQARARQLGIAPVAHDDEEILERCLYPLLNEGFRILEEGIAVRASDIDVVWTSGYGFPRYRGGPMFYAQSIGLPALLAGMEKYAARFGPLHWQPAPLLRELVRSGRTLAQWEADRADGPATGQLTRPAAAP